MKHEFNYFYRIINLINNHYYYGIHSTDNLEDGYMGSGIRLHKAYKKYGMENFTKEILKFFDTRKEASDYEAEMVTEQLVKDVSCYNIIRGGVDYDLTGMVAVFDKEEKEYTFVTQDVYYKLKDIRYVSPSFNTVNVIVKSTNEHKSVTCEEFRLNRRNYSTVCENTVCVKDKLGNFFRVSKNDERYLSGELINSWVGRKHTEETKNKIREAHRKLGYQKGEKNSQYGKVRITKDGINKSISKSDLTYYLENGWVKGKTQKNIKYTTEDIENIINLRKKKLKWKEIQDKLKIPKSSLRDIRKKYNIQ